MAGAFVTMNHRKDKYITLVSIKRHGLDVELSEEAVREAKGMNLDLSPVIISSICLCERRCV